MHNCRHLLSTFRIALLILAGSQASSSADSIKSVEPNEGWKPVSKSREAAIYTRARTDSPLKEFRGVGDIDASTTVVNAVLDDFEHYPQFMPYTVESRLLKQDGDALIGYQRLSLKFCADRDYTLRVVKKSWPSPSGMVFSQRWSPANELGPPKIRGVVRIERCEGSWLLEPEGPNKTRATYSVYTDTGGAIPSFLANYASEVGIGKLFAAIRNQVKNPKYVTR